ncbi:hypothetical protein MRX96_007469 [Rhipicephalus microplus]
MYCWGKAFWIPPQSLQMYPKRYQSPSRCGSPSVEVPEHLLFGSQAQSPLELSGEAQTEHKRGRASRRPVIERFLKKSGESLPGDVFALDTPTASSNQVQPRKEEIAPTPFWPNQQYIRARSLAMPLQAPEPQASFVPVTPQSPLLLGNEQVITSVKELGENKQTDKFARAVSPDQCGLKNSFEDMSEQREAAMEEAHSRIQCACAGGTSWQAERVSAINGRFVPGATVSAKAEPKRKTKEEV